MPTQRDDNPKGYFFLTLKRVVDQCCDAYKEAPHERKSGGEFRFYIERPRLAQKAGYSA